MPLLRIDVIEGRSEDALTQLLDTIHSCIVDALGVPQDDRYQILTEHKRGRMILKDTGLGFTRSDQMVLIQIFTSPRSPSQLKALYALLAERLTATCGLDGQDLMISVTPNGTSDWSFGNGEAQYLTGAL